MIIFFFLRLVKIVKEFEWVTDRKAGGLQMEEIGCKCQTFFSLLGGAEGNKLAIFFSFSIQI